MDLPPGTAATRAAIECLTLWWEPGEQAHLDAAAHIARLLHSEEGPGADQLLTGLLNMCTIFAFRAAKAEGASAENIREAAQAMLREISPHLPE